MFESSWPTIEGLSPRVRGNQIAPSAVSSRHRSIPACAGEPPSPAQPSHTEPVYPRVCGGTGCERAHSCRDAGLSPRVRGNHSRMGAVDQHRRSIPACAGEPAMVCSDGEGSSVYPRVCGGTRPDQAPLCRRGGLSPRVRGNRRRLFDPLVVSRSIPACAGEPVGVQVATAAGGVYPRVCGGTWRRTPDRPLQMGLSPRVRGNPFPAPRRLRSLRSIPACAGEPS